MHAIGDERPVSAAEERHDAQVGRLEYELVGVGAPLFNRANFRPEDDICRLLWPRSNLDYEEQKEVLVVADSRD